MHRHRLSLLLLCSLQHHLDGLPRRLLPAWLKKSDRRPMRNRKLAAPELAPPAGVSDPGLAYVTSAPPTPPNRLSPLLGSIPRRSPMQSRRLLPIFIASLIVSSFLPAVASAQLSYAGIF